MRFKTSKDTANRIVDQEGQLRPTQIQALRTVFEQTAHIANLRDKLAHQHMTPHPDSPDHTLISDTFSTRKKQHEAQTWQVEIREIDAAADDLLEARKWLGSPLEHGHLFSQISDEPPTWRYRPSSLQLLDPETCRALRARRNQPQSSEE
jgi:hypothetical protein